MNEQERQKVAYLVRGLKMYAQQVEKMLTPDDFTKARYAVADRGEQVIQVIQEVQDILRSSDRP